MKKETNNVEFGKTQVTLDTEALVNLYSAMLSSDEVHADSKSEPLTPLGEPSEVTAQRVLREIRAKRNAELESRYQSLPRQRP